MARAPTSKQDARLPAEVASLDVRLRFPPFAPTPPRRHGVSPERCSDVLSTLSDISHAPPDLDGCRHLLELISGELRAEQAVLILSNPLTGELEFVMQGQDSAVAQRYAEYYCDLDPTGLPAYVTGRCRAPADAPQYAVSDLMEVVDYGAFVSTEFYNDFLKSAKIHYDLVAFVSPNSGTRGAICLHRSRQREPFSDEEIAVLDLIAPFVGNHMERMLSAGLQSAVPSAAGKGVIVCDLQGRVLFCNDIARRLCSPLGGRTTGRPLVADSCFVGFTLSSPGALAESCDLGVDSREVGLEHGGAARVFTLEARDEFGRFWSDSVKERFCLSPREIEVLGRLIAGQSNRQISQGLFIAECTVKKHIQSIAAKVGARKRTSIAHTVQQELSLLL
jgi:DNA-binding CsgD family transcriptional regulator